MKGKTILLASAAATMVALTAAPAMAGDWWESTSVSGRMYYDMTNISQDYHDAANVKHDGPVSGTNTYGTGFDIKRFYIGIDHKFNDVFSANVTTDFQYASAISSTELFVKKAYLQAKLDPAFVVRVGSTDLPWVPFVEGVYNYRYVENTLIDRTKYGTSADWGVHIMGDLADKLVSYQLSVVNGNGYKNTSRADGMDFEGRVNLNYEGFIAAVGGYVGQLGTTHGTHTHHDATRFDALLAYVGNGARVGVEYFSADHYSKGYLTSASDSHKADGYSVFASYEFDPEWSVFGKYEYTNPKTSSTSIKDNYYNVGIEYQPFKKINFALVYKHDDAKGGNLSTSNGVIGGTTGALSDGQGNYDEVGVWGAFQW